MILEEISRQKHPGWASFASVSKEWQRVIAKENLGRLRLEVSCLDDFERLMVRQRHLIRNIQFEIELPRYSCGRCIRRASADTQQGEKAAFGYGLWRLFTILSTWKKSSKINGLTLDLNAYSPSDSEHWFKNYYFSSHARGNDDDDNCKWNDPGHGWVNGQQVFSPPASAIPRLFSHIEPDASQEEIPPVRCITRLIIRRQLRRSFTLFSSSSCCAS